MSSYECSEPGCTRHPSKGDTIIRTSPKGGPFAGSCEEHYSGPMTGEDIAQMESAAYMAQSAWERPTS